MWLIHRLTSGTAREGLIAIGIGAQRFLNGLHAIRAFPLGVRHLLSLAAFRGRKFDAFALIRATFVAFDRNELFVTSFALREAGTSCWK